MSSESCRVEVGCVSAIGAAEVTQRNRRIGALSMMDNSLDPEIHVSGPIRGATENLEMRIRLGRNQQLNPARYRELDYLIETLLRGNSG